MSFLELLKIEFMKVKRSKIVPLIFIAPLLVVASGVASLSRYFTPEYTNAWPAMFIQSALVYAYYLLPFSTACSGLERLSDNLRDGADQLSDDVVIGKSNALITPYQSFEGSRTSDNDAFQATYDASVVGFDGQDILVADTDLKENECREITIQYSFDVQSGNCQLIYISPELKETVLAENENGSVTVQLQEGANYIGINGTGYSGSIQIAIE